MRPSLHACACLGTELSKTLKSVTQLFSTAGIEAVGSHILHNARLKIVCMHACCCHQCLYGVLDLALLFAFLFVNNLYCKK